MLLLIAVTAAITVAINHAIPKYGASYHQGSTYRTPAWLRQHVTLGYRRMLAVLYWFDVIGNFGGKLADEADYSLLTEKLDTITTLDPYAGHAYYTAATTLTWQLHSTRLSGPLLERGIRMMPEEWRWPYYRGFYSYFFDHDDAVAARYLAMAARRPGVPAVLIRLAGKMRAARAGLDTAQLFLEQMLKKRQDPEIRAQLESEIKKIRTERVLRELERRLAVHPGWHGDVARLEQLGIDLPDTLPDGGKVVFDDHLRPVSSVEKRRYRLFQPPKNYPKIRALP